MANVTPIHVGAAELTEAGSVVAGHLETAAMAPAASVPTPVAASPVDVAAAGAANALRTQMAAMSSKLTTKSGELQTTTTTAAAALQARDATNASPLKDLASAIPSGGSSGGTGSSGAGSAGAGRIEMAGHGFKADSPPPSPGAAPSSGPGAVHRQPPSTMRLAPPIATGPGYDPSKHNPRPGELEEDTARVAAGIGGDLLLPESAGIKGPLSVGEDLLNGKTPKPGDGIGVAIGGFNGFEQVKDGFTDAMHTNPPAMKPDFIDDFLHDRTHFWEDGTGQPTR